MTVELLRQFSYWESEDTETVEVLRQWTYDNGVAVTAEVV